MAVASRRKVFSNLFWRYMERTTAQFVSFVVSIILARLLSPTEFGTVALMNVFISIMQVFGSAGLGSALIQKKDADDLDYSTVFWSQLFLCATAYLVIFLLSPAIASFYSRLELISMIRISSISILIFGIRNIQLSYVSKHLEFKKFFLSTLIGTIIAAVVGIILAYHGAGTWALITQHLTNLFVDACVLWLVVKWHPHFSFSITRLKKLLEFGINVFLTSILDTVYNDIRSLVIGKVYSPAELGCYNRGKSFPNLVVSNISTSINSVLFPVMSEVQDDINKIRAMTRRSMKMGMFILAPVMLGIAAVAPNLVDVLLTQKWEECIPFVRIFCIALLLSPLGYANLNAIKALGRSDIIFYLSIIKKITGVIFLFITLRHGVKAIALGYLANAILAQIINSVPNKKFLNYGYLNQLSDIIPSLILSGIMVACILPIQYLVIPRILILFMQVILGVLIYILGAALFKIEAYNYAKEILIKGISKKRSENKMQNKTEMNKKVIITADDFGRSHERNMAIDYAFKNNLIKCSGLIINSEFTEEAVKLASAGGYIDKCHLHFNYLFPKETSFGKILLRNIKFLFCYNKIYDSLEKQYQKFLLLTDNKGYNEHVDFHLYSNLSIPIALAYKKFIKKHDIKSARYYGEQLKITKKKKVLLIKFLGCKQKIKSSNIDFYLTTESLLNENVVELYCHPDYWNSALMDNTQSIYKHEQRFLIDHITELRKYNGNEVSWKEVDFDK